MAACVAFLLDGAAVLIALPVAVLVAEIVAALAARPAAGRRATYGRLAVLVPAHDEGAGMVPTLSGIRAQLREGDQMLVVADNCTDDTARVAQAAGAEVIARHDPVRRGKGYALQFGLDHLSMDPPDIVVCFDADSALAPLAIDRLASTCAATGRPVQALYLMRRKEPCAVNHQVAEFAWRVRNRLRPLGLSRLGLPCQLTGSGMAFPFGVIRSVDLATGSIVEDMKLGLDLARAGFAPVFCPSALVTSTFAPSQNSARAQRQRWEHGHIAMMVKVPRLLAASPANPPLLALALDLAVPPLSLQAVMLAAITLVAAAAAFCGISAAALAIALAGSLGFSAAVFLAWLADGRDVLPPAAVLQVAPYVFSKLSMYGRVLTGRAATDWVRTQRK